MNLEIFQELGETNLTYIISSFPDDVKVYPIKHDKKLFNRYFKGFRPDKLSDTQIFECYEKEIFKRNNVQLIDYVGKQFLKIHNQIQLDIETELKKINEDLSQIAELDDEQSFKIISIILEKNDIRAFFIVSKLCEVVFSPGGYSKINDQIRNNQNEILIRNAIKIEFEDEYKKQFQATKSKLEKSFEEKILLIQDQLQKKYDDDLQKIQHEEEEKYQAAILAEKMKLEADSEKRTEMIRQKLMEEIPEAIKKLVIQQKKEIERLSDEKQQLATELQSRDQQIGTLELSLKQARETKDELELALQQEKNKNSELNNKIMELTKAAATIKVPLDKWKINPDLQFKPTKEQDFLNRLKNLFSGNREFNDKILGLHIALKSNRLVLVSNDSARIMISAYAECLGETCQTHIIQIEHHFSGTQDLFGQANNLKNFQPSKNQLVDFWLAAQRAHQEKQTGIFFLVLNNCDSGLMDQYLAEVCAAMDSVSSSSIHLFHPANVLATDPYFQYSSLKFPPNLWIIGVCASRWEAAPNSPDFLANFCKIEFPDIHDNSRQQIFAKIEEMNESPITLQNYLKWQDAQEIEIPQEIIQALNSLTDLIPTSILRRKISCLFANGASILQKPSLIEMIFCGTIKPQLEMCGQFSASLIDEIIKIFPERDYFHVHQFLSKLKGSKNGK